MSVGKEGKKAHVGGRLCFQTRTYYIPLYGIKSLHSRAFPCNLVQKQQREIILEHK